MRALALLLLLDAPAARAESSIPSVIDKRWAVTMGYGVATLRDRSDDPQQLAAVAVDFGVRFRVRPELELGLELTGAVSRGYGIVGFVANVRYRMLAERPWNPYLLGGLGPGSWAPDGGTKLFLHAGLGLERRYTSWAFTGELRLAHVGGDSTVEVTGTRTTLQHFGGFGVSSSIAAIYYWGGSRRSRRFVP